MTQQERFDEIERRILERIGSQVSFQYAEPKLSREGELADRVTLNPYPGSTDDISYWNVIDLIRFPDETEKEWMRVSYYKNSGSRLVWGGMTALTEPISAWKRLFVHAAREMPWFRNLLKDVMRELDEASE